MRCVQPPSQLNAAAVQQTQQLCDSSASAQTGQAPPSHSTSHLLAQLHVGHPGQLLCQDCLLGLPRVLCNVLLVMYWQHSRGRCCHCRRDLGVPQVQLVRRRKLADLAGPGQERCGGAAQAGSQRHVGRGRSCCACATFWKPPGISWCWTLTLVSSTCMFAACEVRSRQAHTGVALRQAAVQ